MEGQTIKTLEKFGLVPVVVLQDSAQAVPLADAYTQGGLPVMEITLRTEAGLPSIEKLCAERPEMLIGAGTVLSLDQCRDAVKAGAKFIVTPGFDPQIADWCVENGVELIPGCVTPTEIGFALARGIRTVKFFPANVYGGIKACQALQGPFGAAGIRFVPTGGIDLKNLDEYADKSCIAAVGGGWLCDKKLLAAGDYDGIAEIVRRSIDHLLGLEIAHVGLNAGNDESGRALAKEIGLMLSMPVREGMSSLFAGESLEVMKGAGRGEHGHIAVHTNSVERAVFYLERRGWRFAWETAKHKNGRLNAIYLEKDFGGFAVHLLQK